MNYKQFFNFNSEKNIEIIGASKNSTQIKYAGEVLNKFPNLKNSLCFSR